MCCSYFIQPPRWVQLLFNLPIFNKYFIQCLPLHFIKSLQLYRNLVFASFFFYHTSPYNYTFTDMLIHEFQLIKNSKSKTAVTVYPLLSKPYKRRYPTLLPPSNHIFSMKPDLKDPVI